MVGGNSEIVVLYRRAHVFVGVMGFETRGVVDGPVPGRVVPFNAPGTEQGVYICGRVRLDRGFSSRPCVPVWP